MHPQQPPFWRDDLTALLPSADAANATWLANLIAAYPWCNVVGHIRLHDRHEVVLKFHTRREDFECERAGARLLTALPGLLIAPALLGAAEQRMVLAFEYVNGPDLVAVLDGTAAPTAWHAAVEAVAALHRAAEQRQADWLDL